MRIIFGILCGLFVLATGGVMSDIRLNALVNFNAFAFVLITSGIVSFIRTNPGHLLRSYLAALKSQPMAPETFLRTGLNFLASGLLGCLIGFANVLKNFSNPDAIGLAAHFSVSSVIYGALGYLFFCLCFQTGCERLSSTKPNAGLGSNNATAIIVTRSIGFVAVLFIAPMLSSVSYASLIYFLTGLIVFFVSAGKHFAGMMQYFERSVLISGSIGVSLAFIRTASTLSEKESIPDGFHLAVTSLIYTFIFVWFGRIITTESENEASPAVKLHSGHLLYYFFASAALLTIECLTLILRTEFH